MDAVDAVAVVLLAGVAVTEDFWGDIRKDVRIGGVVVGNVDEVVVVGITVDDAEVDGFRVAVVGAEGEDGVIVVVGITVECVEVVISIDDVVLEIGFVSVEFCLVVEYIVDGVVLVEVDVLVNAIVDDVLIGDVVLVIDGVAGTEGIWVDVRADVIVG